MLRSLKSIEGYALKAQDGDIGVIKEFLFDDVSWIVRYLVAKTRKWLPGKTVLISPKALGMPDWEYKNIPVSLDRETIKASPDMKKYEILTRDIEKKVCEHYMWPEYWCDTPAVLHNTEDVKEFTILARDGEIGKVKDFIIDDKTWRIRYLVVDISGLLSGKEVLLSPDWVDEIVPEGKQVRLNILKKLVRDSPEYNPKDSVNRKQEEVLYDYYGKPMYWIEVSNPDKRGMAKNAR